MLTKVQNLNDDPNIHGIIVQMPLDSEHKIDSHLITDAVSPEKDVDGYERPFNAFNFFVKINFLD